MRRLICIAKGFLGLATPIAKEGDVVCLLYGGAVPFILRPEGQHYLLVGDCYVHEVVDGEALEFPGATDIEFEIH